MLFQEAAAYTDNPWESYLNLPFRNKRKKGEGGIVTVSDEFLRSRGGIRALKSYITLLYDSTVQANMIKLVQEITSRELKVEPFDEEEINVKIAQEVQEQLSNLNMDEYFRKASEAYITGSSPGEVMWARENKKVIAKEIRMRDPRRFVWAESPKTIGGFILRLLTRQYNTEGVDIPGRKIIPFRYWVSNNGDPYGSGLGRVLYFLVKVKRRALESEVLYNDRFATPTAVVNAPQTATVSEVDMAKELISNLSQETGVVMPEGWMLDFVNPVGKPEVFVALREYLNKEISILIAGEDEAGSADSGSRASSEVALDVRVRKAQELSELICSNLEKTLVKWIVELNFGKGHRIPKIYRDFVTEAPSTLTAQDLATLKEKFGLLPDYQWLEKHFRVEFQKDEEGQILVQDTSGESSPEDLANSFFQEETEEPQEESL